MLVASRPIGLLDRYRVPYTVEPEIADGFIKLARADGTGPQLLSLGAAREAPERDYVFEGAVLHVALAAPAAFEAMLDHSHLEWNDELAIVDLDAVPRAAVRRATDGSLALPFAIDQPLEALLEERYVSERTGYIGELVRRGYYRVRPVLPYRLQMALRRRFRRLQERTVFPAWPTETSLHRLEALLLGFVEQVAGEPLPWLSPWPQPYEWALVLTHDIERAAGYQHVGEVLAVEERHDLRSAWYFVPERDYTVEEGLLERLRTSGCEIGLHGLRHDGRDMSPSVFKDRLPAMKSYLSSWGARGFRAPATHRDDQLLKELDVDHDSSWSDVARYEPQPGGTCSWLPFFIGRVVELPITLPMDHTLFELRREQTADLWVEKTAFIRAQGGMALLVTHPDYLLDSHRLDMYEQFIAQQRTDPSAWHALPRDVAAWWRQRAESHLELCDGSWVARGPAATEARVRLGAPEPPPSSARS
jgi:peptidoglycan/xylan/chitin deacetylase (PgdA/CDA1 family)